MIKFFRNIRKKLLKEGRTTKYLKYAIGEIVLVVIGILIALQINNWNEARTKKQILRAQINNLIDDLKLDQYKIDNQDTINNFRFYAINYLLKMSGTNIYNAKDDKTEIPPYKPSFIWKNKIPNVYDKDFIQLAFLWSHRTSRYSANVNALNELNSTGYFSSIDPDTKLEINVYYYLWGTYFKDIVDELANDWLVSLGEDGFTNADTYHLEDPLILIKNHPERIALLKRMARESGWVLKGTAILKKSNEELISLLNKDLEK